MVKVAGVRKKAAEKVRRGGRVGPIGQAQPICRIERVVQIL